MALSGLPNFSQHLPNAASGSPSPHHQCTIHLNCESTQLLHDAYLPALSGRYSSRLAVLSSYSSSTILSVENPLVIVIAPFGVVFLVYPPYSARVRNSRNTLVRIIIITYAQF